MRTKLVSMAVEFQCTYTEKEARILHHVASFLRANNWAEHYSKHFSEDTRASAEEFDGVMQHLHTTFGHNLMAVEKSREELAKQLHHPTG